MDNQTQGALDLDALFGAKSEWPIQFNGQTYHLLGYDQIGEKQYSRFLVFQQRLARLQSQTENLAETELAMDQHGERYASYMDKMIAIICPDLASAGGLTFQQKSVVIQYYDNKVAERMAELKKAIAPTLIGAIFSAD